ncbi:MAG: FHA domain-containing protein [Lentisphaerota bacterium]
MKKTPVLIVLSETDKGQTFPLTNKAYLCGRSTVNIISFKDPTVSSTHCEFVKSDSNTYLVRDMDSTNGTKVNGISIKSLELKNGDIIRLGKIELLYSLESDSQASTETKTIIDLSKVADSAPLKPMENVSRMPKSSNSKNEKLASQITVYVLIALAVAIIGLILWLFAISK